MNNTYRINSDLCISIQERVCFVTSLTGEEDFVYRIDGIAKDIFSELEKEDSRSFEDIVSDISKGFDPEHGVEITKESKSFLDDLLRFDIVRKV